MSLVTDFSDVTKKISKAITKTKSIFGEITYDNQNKWQRRRYSLDMSSAPTLTNIENMTPAAVGYINDMDSYSDWEWADHYVGYMQCYVNCNQDYNLSTSFYTDDKGRFYCNGEALNAISDNGWVGITIPLKKGWNKLIVIFQEGAGGDGAALRTKLSTQSFITEMYANITYDTTGIYE